MKQILFPIFFAVRDRATSEKDKAVIEKMAYGETPRGVKIQNTKLINTKSGESLDLSNIISPAGLFEKLCKIVKLSKKSQVADDDSDGTEGTDVNVVNLLFTYINDNKLCIDEAQKLYFYFNMGISLKCLSIDDINIVNGRIKRIDGISIQNGKVINNRTFPRSGMQVAKFQKIEIEESWNKFVKTRG